MKHLVRILRVAIASAVIASVSTCGVGVMGHAELAQAATIRFTSAAPSAPIPNPVTDHDTVVAGKAKVGLTVVVKTANALLGSTPVNSDGTFSLAISPLNGGTLLYITALDQTTGRSSSAARVTVRDTTAPLPPVVARVGDSYTTVTGAAEPSSTVSVYAGTKSLGSAKAKSDGTFTVSIRKQASGAVLSVFATDASKNKSEATSVTVVDTTPPQLKSVNPATDTSTVITGLADKNVTINVRKGDTLLGTATSRADGTFSVTIAPQVGGSVLAVTAADELQNESIAKTVTVKDTTPPSVPIVQPVTDKDKTVTGTTEANATVKVKVGTRTLGSAKANAQGSFTVPISPTSGGSILSVTATDAAQNSSSAATRSVIDTTAPTAPRANAVKDTDLVVTGTAEAYATLTATIGDKQFKGTAGKDGKYSIAIEQQDLNAVLSLTATDASGNKSAATSVKVVAGALALNSAVVADATSSLQLSRKNATSYTSTENTLFSDQAVGTVTFAFNKKISKSSANDIGVYLNSSRTQVPDAIKNLLLSKLQDGASNELTVHLSLTYQQLKNALNLFNDRPVTSLRIVVKDLHGNSSTITLTIK